MKTSILTAFAAASRAAQTTLLVQPDQCMPSDPVHVDMGRNPLAAPLTPMKPRGTSDFLSVLHRYGEKSTTFLPLPSDATLTPSLSDSAACDWIERKMENALAPDDMDKLQQAMDGAKLVHKTSVRDMRRLLETFPAFAEGAKQKSICATLVPETPFLTTFNRHDSKFYGVILNPERMVPILTGPNDLFSLCRYDAEKWDKSAVPDWSGNQQPPLWNGKQILNVSPDGELCHDMTTSMKVLTKDIVFDEGGHDYIERGKVLGTNELIVAKNDDAQKAIAKGIFLDLVSNVFLMQIARPLGRTLLSANTPQMNERILQSVQATNIRKIDQLLGDFAEVKKLCAEYKLPFLLRSLSPTGEISFKEVDISDVSSVLDLLEVNTILSKHNDPALDRVIDKISNIFSL